jgi:hypothetical protein
MKTNFMKQVVPVAVFALAIAGAFTTHAMSEHSKTLAPVQGYLRLDPEGDECEERDECSTVNNGIVCTVGLVPAGAQLYGKNSADNCTIPIYRP